MLHQSGRDCNKKIKGQEQTERNFECYTAYQPLTNQTITQAHCVSQASTRVSLTSAAFWSLQMTVA